MLTLNVGTSKKQQGSEPYSSIGASCNISVEVAEDLLKNPESLQKKIASIFGEVRRAVDEQIQNGLNGNPISSGGGNASRDGENETSSNNKSGNARPISEKQKAFIISLASQTKGNGGLQALEKKMGKPLSEWSRAEASSCIKLLKGA